MLTSTQLDDMRGLLDAGRHPRGGTDAREALAELDRMLRDAWLEALRDEAARAGNF
jgi:hypothetical protein